MGVLISSEARSLGEGIFVHLVNSESSKLSVEWMSELLVGDEEDRRIYGHFQAFSLSNLVGCGVI